MTKKQDHDPILVQRGKRIKNMRLQLRYSRPAWERKYGIPRGTLQNWEDGRFGGLTQEGSQRLINALEQEGIKCSPEWLFFGVGEDPMLNYNPRKLNNTPEKDPRKLPEKSKILHELRYFHKGHEDAIDFQVPDGQMQPRFIQGETVAGVRCFDEDIANLIGEDCIVQTMENEVLLRRLQAGSRPGVYALFVTHPEEALDQQDVELFSAAKVVWARRVLQ